jgi:acyl-CoA dehydrogenase
VAHVGGAVADDEFNFGEGATLRSPSTTPSMTIQFDPIRLPAAAQELRCEVREFIRAEIASGTFDPSHGAMQPGYSPEFSRRVGANGWIGITWPKKYGGQERSFLERYVITEEFRVANAPVALHFTADRQSGPMLLKYANETIKAAILPRIARGECCFCIGMSEPNSGSDLFAANVRADACDGGFRVRGTKVWTTGAHHADYMIGIFRTAPSTKDNRRHGLTQFLVDMKSPGITVNPIANAVGQREFNEVVFDDMFLPAENALGEIDMAWKQATSELAYERSGPERFLETSYLLFELLRVLGPTPDTRAAEGIGRLVAQLHTLRRMSVSVNGMLQAGKEPVLEGSIVKDLGTVWQQQLPHKARDLAAFVDGDKIDRKLFDTFLEHATKVVPKLTIQGGTTEVLRGIIARGLGLR